MKTSANVAGMLFFTALAVHAAGLGTRIAGDNDGWAVMRNTDMMTDKPSCVAIYKGDGHIQAGYNDSGREYLWVSGQGRGGVQGFQYRIDNETASSMQLPTASEKKISAVDVGARAGVENVKRVRVEVQTVLGSSFQEDIDMTSLEKVKPILQGSQCH